MFYIFYGFVWLLTLLPLRALYLISDFAYIIVYYVAGYRKKTVRINLRNSFPQKTDREIRKIERRFYRSFCDTFIEALKKLHISDEEMMRRFTFEKPEILIKHFEEGKSIILMTAHYGNWEWFSSFSLHTGGKYCVTQVYQQQKSKNFNGFMLYLRSRFSTVNIEQKQALRAIIRIKQEGITTVFGLLSDQSPKRSSTHYRTRFLNQDTPVITGAETFAKKTNFPVIFGKVSRTKRGYYRMEFIPIALDPAKTTDFEITETYMRLLEKVIEEEPAYWLWTHKRWKHVSVYSL
ncbi:MAG: lysophospholipid acyltransferase family protein [Prevotellaceae bacterium]|jgi:KDO2-lipid IV(A) lauroyltransferase|nr:lysophospholipid acyltransferase family protein [Prevotellaceae bacterium]